MRHARPARLYPPIPKGHASDQQTLVGVLVTSRFMEIPACALARNSSQRAKSSAASALIFRLRRFVVLDLSGGLSPSRIRLRKCLAFGSTYAVWFSRPTSVSSAAWEQRPDFLTTLMSPSQAWYLSLGREISRLRVLIVQPKTVCTSSGRPSAISLVNESIGRRGTGSSLSPA